MGIQGNDSADAEAKGASERTEEPIPINHSDWGRIIRNALVGEWKQRWGTCRDKLREIKSEPETWIDCGKYSRRDEVIISRMRLGHTLLTHGYLVFVRVGKYFFQIAKKCVAAPIINLPAIINITLIGI